MLYNINSSDCIKIYNIRPEIIILLNQVKVNALIDSGSEITCISENFHKNHNTQFQHLPTLPTLRKIIKENLKYLKSNEILNHDIK